MIGLPVVVAAADETSHAEARLAKPSQASQSREGLTNRIGYFCDGRGQAQGLTSGCESGYIQFVTGPFGIIADKLGIEIEIPLDQNPCFQDV